MGHPAATPTLAAPAVPLLCTSCGRVAATLQLSELPADARGFLTPLLAMLRFKTGVAIELRPGSSPLAAFKPSDLAAFFGARCPSCSTSGGAIGPR